MIPVLVSSPSEVCLHLDEALPLIPWGPMTRQPPKAPVWNGACLLQLLPFWWAFTVLHSLANRSLILNHLCQNNWCNLFPGWTLTHRVLGTRSVSGKHPQRRDSGTAAATSSCPHHAWLQCQWSMEYKQEGKCWSQWCTSLSNSVFSDIP